MSGNNSDSSASVHGTLTNKLISLKFIVIPYEMLVNQPNWLHSQSMLVLIWNLRLGFKVLSSSSENLFVSYYLAYSCFLGLHDSFFYRFDIVSISIVVFSIYFMMWLISVSIVTSSRTSSRHLWYLNDRFSFFLFYN